MEPNRTLYSADPRSAFFDREDEIRAAIGRVLGSGQYILGPEVEKFERAWASYLGGGYCATAANGTEAIELALRAAGVRPGDLVATVANTVSATVAAIQQTGARPVLVEIEDDTMLMDPVRLEECLSIHDGRIRAVIPVHLYGQPCDMARIVEICWRHGARVIEDCAQSHGAMIGDRKAATFGDLATFSFYPTKNLGALGDGGAVFTRDPELDEEVRLLKNYGWRTRYVSEIPGRNSRLDEIQAAVLNVKLPHLDEANAFRRTIASRYIDQLRDANVTLPAVRDGVTHVWHQFAIRVRNRDRVHAAMRDDGIVCGTLYPVPIHHQPAYLDLSLSLPISESACAGVLCLPCYTGLGFEDVDRVSAAVREHTR